MKPRELLVLVGVAGQHCNVYYSTPLQSIPLSPLSLCKLIVKL